MLWVSFSGVIVIAVISLNGMWTCLKAALDMALFLMYITVLGGCSAVMVGSMSVHEWCRREESKSFD